MSSVQVPKKEIAVQAFRAPQGCLAHLVIDPSSREAMVIDPRLDQIDEIVGAAEAENATIRYVMDTHTHADHLSGVRGLAKITGAQILAHPKAKVAPARKLEDGAEFALGESVVRVLHSPGHTPDSLSLEVDGHLFTGDALFAGSAGRTDFMGGSARELYQSFRRFERLPRETVVHPGHDYVGIPQTTLEREMRENDLLREKDVDRLAGRLDVKGPLPANMKSILAFNTRGGAERLVSAIELDALRRLRNRVQVVDVRSPSEFRAQHIDGAVNLPFNELERRFDEIGSGGETILVCQSGVRSEEAAQMFSRRGRKTRQLDGGMAAWVGAGLETAGRGGVSIERQVQMTIGASVLAGATLGAALTPWLLIVPAFMGAGLLYAGISGTCALASVIARLPWNRRSTDETAACAAAGSSSCAPTTSAGCAATTSAGRTATTSAGRTAPGKPQS